MSCDEISVRHYFHTTEDIQKSDESVKSQIVSRPRKFYFIHSSIIYQTPNNYQGLCKGLGAVKLREGPISWIWMAISLSLAVSLTQNVVCSSIISSKSLQNSPESFNIYSDSCAHCRGQMWFPQLPDRLNSFLIPVLDNTGPPLWAWDHLSIFRL